MDKESSSLSIKEKNSIQTKTLVDSINFEDIADLIIEDKEIEGSSIHRRKGYYVRLVLKSGASPIITSYFIPQNSAKEIENTFLIEKEKTEEAIKTILDFIEY